jgi:hypothetical protein
MATLTIRHDIDVVLGGEVIRLTNASTPPTLTVTKKVDNVYTLADTTTIIVWDPTLPSVPVGVTDFKLLYILSDAQVYLEAVGSKALTPSFSSIPIAANVPLVLGADDTYINYTVASADIYTGTLGVINRLRIRNVSGSTATIRVVLFT